MIRRNSISIILLFYVLILLFSREVFSQEADLGSNQKYLSAPLDYGFIEWGLAKEANYNVLRGTVHVDGSQLVFSSKTIEICWYGLLGQKGALKNVMFSSGFEVEWFGPDGKLVFSEKIKPVTSMMIKSELRLKNPSLGVWIVKVSKKNQVIDTRRFKIV